MSATSRKMSSPQTSVHLTSGHRSGVPQLLGRVTFDLVADRAGFTIPLQALSQPSSEEWFSFGDVTRGTTGSVEWSVAGDVMLGALRRETETRVDDATLDLYREMIRFTREAGFPHFLRIWNHLGRINEPQDGLERYRRFSIGRHQAFEEAGYRFENDLPAASAVGCHEDSLVTYFLASRQEPKCLENARQVSAFAYPPLYGPKSPSFSRAAVVRWSDRFQLFLSGTASIVGHQSVHIGDVDAQLDETFHNIDVLLARASVIEPEALFTTDSLVFLKIYVRNAPDFDRIRLQVMRRLPHVEVSYVVADICRKELLLEIEGIAESLL